MGRQWGGGGQRDCDWAATGRQWGDDETTVGKQWDCHGGPQWGSNGTAMATPWTRVGLRWNDNGNPLA
eukprot:2318706-Lingulodinium_polyedra.AAC.1